MNSRIRGHLNIEKVLSDFQKSEQASAHRKGSFKIEAPFEKALDAILKSKPKQPKK